VNNLQCDEHVYATVMDAIYNHANRRGERIAYGCLSSEGALERSLTYRELVSQAESVAAELLRSLQPGDRTILLFHGGPEFIVSFLGCLIAGVIAVPAYPVRVPTSPTQPARNFERLIPMLANARPKVALTTRPVADRQAELCAADPVFSQLRWIAVEEIPGQPLENRPEVAGEDVAFLQYTSGSTSVPKGVMVTHNNLLSVFQDMDAGWPHDESSVMVSWVPVFHDMGLIHGVLFPLYFGFPVYTLIAASVLQHPRMWLEAIARFRGTHSSGPNFIFELCLKRISEQAAAELDLSSLRACLTGAEAIRAKTLERFRERFAVAGLRPEAIQPGYGLAEFTLTVSSIDVGKIAQTVHLDLSACEQGRVVLAASSSTKTRSFVSCGWTHVGSEIHIVDPESHRECPPSRIGEIWARGKNLTKGYWENQEANQLTMGARLEDGTGPFLRTGDLGFVIGGEVYVAGRLKDLIIIRGRNIYPHDVEATVEEVLPEVRSGRCSAISIDREEGEALVIIAEVDRAHRNGLDTAQAFAKLREAISMHHEAEIYDAVFVRTGTFPLTSSGKVQRRRARQEYLEGKLHIVASIRGTGPQRVPVADEREQRAAEIREWLVNYLATKLGQERENLSATLSFQRLGLDSLSLLEMIMSLEEFTGHSLDSAVLFDHPSIEQLSRHVGALQQPLSAGEKSSLMPKNCARAAGGPA
jgi:acyl-CoA synthetase (AMP-forming)/AMP-acid ligase II/acyl carrier protein